MILGVTIRKLDANRVADLGKGRIDVMNSPSLGAAKEHALDAVGKKAVAVEFTFVTKYTSPERELAKIEMGGDVIYMGDDSQEILSHWKVNKAFPVDFAVKILNATLRKCVTKSIQLAEEFQLPPPIDYPTVLKGEPPNQDNNKKKPSA